jgi:cytochrome c
VTVDYTRITAKATLPQLELRGTGLRSIEHLDTPDSEIRVSMRHTIQSMFIVPIAGAVMATVAFAGGAPDKADPKVAFNNHCRTCHSAEPGDNRLGPSLHGVMGRKAGSVEGFAYSPGFKTTDLVWDEANMDQFIANPNSLFPGNNMAPFAGLSDAAERKQIIEFLKTLK